MQDAYCCGREMYQEIQSDNYLVSICRSCGNTRKQRVSFNGKPADGIEYFGEKNKDNVEKFNTISESRPKGDTNETL